MTNVDLAFTLNSVVFKITRNKLIYMRLPVYTSEILCWEKNPRFNKL